MSEVLRQSRVITSPASYGRPRKKKSRWNAQNSLFFFIIYLSKANQLDIVDNKVIAEIDAYILHFEYGSVTHLHNKLIFETYTPPTNHPKNSRVLTWAGEMGSGRRIGSLDKQK